MYSISTRQERRLLWQLALTQFTIIMDFMVMMPLGQNRYSAFPVNARRAASPSSREDE